MNSLFEKYWVNAKVSSFNSLCLLPMDKFLHKYKKEMGRTRLERSANGVLTEKHLRVAVDIRNRHVNVRRLPMPRR